MHIDVVIPFLPEKRLGECCNDIMERCEDWVLFLDQDILLLNHRWYQLCLDAVEYFGHCAGFITCVTNRIGCKHQKCKVPDSYDMKFHDEYGETLYQKYKDDPYVDCTDSDNGFSGLFILTHKKAWEAAGGFVHKFLGMDTAYYGAVKRAGYKNIVMRHLYVYHHYQRKWKNG